MRIIFFWNTKYSVISLEKLHIKFPILAVVTISDRMVGRKKILTPSPVKIFAQNQGIQIIEADKLTEEKISMISKINPDFLVVADYGLILPQKLLDTPKIAPLNVHHSLLPKYRGPSPAPAAILAGEKVSGVTIIKMVDKVDAGDILDQKEYEIASDETTDSLLKALNNIGGELAAAVIERFSEIEPKKQAEDKATYSKMIKKDDGYFEIESPPGPEILDRMIRAYYPWPTAWTKWSSSAQRASADKKEKVIKFLPGKRVQIEGKKPVELDEFLRGYPSFPLQTLNS